MASWKILVGGGGVLGALAVVSAAVINTSPEVISIFTSNNKPDARIRVFGVEKEPITIVGNEPTEIPVSSNEDLTLDGRASDDDDGRISKFEWFINDELVGELEYYTFSKEYRNNEGNKYDVELKVTDNKNEPGLVSLWIVVEPGSQKSSDSPHMWLPVKSGSRIPQGALKIGEENGQPRYLCRFLDGNQFRIGKTVVDERSGNAICNFPYYESLKVVSSTHLEISEPDEPDEDSYEVLVQAEPQTLDWVNYNPLRNDDYPSDAFSFTESEDAQEASICKASYEGAEHPGVVKEGFCVFSHGDRVGFVPNEENQVYQVLIENQI